METATLDTTKPRARKPRPGQLYDGQDNYWNNIATRDPLTKNLPVWSFDFISIHAHMDNAGNVTYSYVSPMCLVDDAGNRPSFEAISLPTLREAIAGARDACRARTPEHTIFIVICK